MLLRSRFSVVFAVALVGGVLYGVSSTVGAAGSACASGWSDAGNSVCELVLSYNGTPAGVTPAAIGTSQLVPVPPGVTSMTMIVAGGEGGPSADPAEGSGVSAGGLGGRATATVPVTPGDTLTVVVGASGPTVPPGGWVLCGTCGPTGAFGAGGLASSNYGGDGGGGSFVFDGLANPDGSVGHALVVAGGGGGGGYDYNTTASHGLYGPQQAPGGAGSGMSPAGDGQSVAFQYDPTFNPPPHYPPGGGGGATPSAAGAGGHSQIPSSYAFGQVDGLPGGGPAVAPDPTQPAQMWLSLGWGGNSQKGTCCYYYGEAGGGGGGYYGGGGGGSIEADLEGGGGGGGAGYVATNATNVVNETGVQSGDGQVTLRYVVPTGAVSYVASSANPSQVGQSVTLTAQAANGSLAGAVSFFDGPTLLGTKTASGGIATLTTKALAVGDHSITVTAAGFPTSAAYVQHVAPATTATSLVATPTTSVYGQSVLLKATVKRVAPATGTVTTGTVGFYDNGSLLATKTVVTGAASISTKTLAVGSHSITAVFSGSTTDANSTSTPAAQSVTQAATTLTLTSSTSGISVFTQKVTFKAVVKRAAPATGAPTGTVDFYDELGTLAMGVPLNSSGVATLTLSTLPVGLHAIHADYNGSTNDLISHSTITQTVNAASTTTSLAASPLITTVGKTVTLTITVKRLAPATGTPDGTITILDNSQPIAAATLLTGKAVIKTNTLAVGTHSLTALYGGNGNYNGSQSSVITVTIN